MNNYAKLLLCGLMALMSLPAIGQSSPQVPLRSGGFGHFFVGPAFFQLGDLQPYLEGAAILGTPFSRQMGTIIGGEGTSLMGRFLIGGGGYGTAYQPVSSSDARVSMGMGAGYLKVGYLLFSRPNHLLYVSTGLGGAGMGIDINNLDVESGIPFNEQAPLAKGQQESYGLGGFLFDPSVGYKLLVGYPDEGETGIGGLMIGFDAGLNMMMPVAEWDANGAIVTGPPVPGMIMAPYVRITIGGGGFGF